MKKALASGIVVVGLTAGGFLGAQSPPAVPEVEALRSELEAARRLLETQQARIGEMEKRLQELEARLEPPQSPAGPSPVSAAAPPAAPARLTWKGGTTTLAFPQAELRLQNRLQLLWTDSHNGDPEKADSGAFRIRRFKTQLQGWAYIPELTYLLQVDWTNANTPQGILDDAAVNYDVTRGEGRLQIRAGQFKTPFGRQSIASTRTGMFADRSFVTYAFCSIRDVGVMVHGKVGPQDHPDLVEYAVGLFNGEGRGRYDNPDGKYQKNLRLVLSPWGSAGYDEAGLFEASTFRLSLGAAYEKNDRRRQQDGVPVSNGWHETKGYDLLARWGRLTLYGEYFDRRAWAFPEETVRSDGLNAQAGFLLVPERWEVFGGYWTYDPAKGASGDRRVEWGLGTNLYIAGFSSKLQADARRARDEKKGTWETEFRLQYQLVF